MKKTLLALTTALTAAAASLSLYVASLPSPTEMQKQLGNTANTRLPEPQLFSGC
jgi:hypothetical protein